MNDSTHRASDHLASDHLASDHLICAIMAGGSGTRFWPLSRHQRPKQLLSLLHPVSLLRATVDRIAPICPAERILVVTAERLAEATAADLPNLPRGNIIAEPAPRNTAPCMALAAIAAQQLDPDAIVALLPADHHVADAPRFTAALAEAAEHAARGHITTLGIAPSRPETGYGYIEVGDHVDGDTSAVVRFVEKPDLETALTYVSGGKHLWNGGIFVSRADVALAAVRDHLPDVHEALGPLHDGASGPFASDSFRQILGERFGACPGVSIDYGIAEHIDDLRTVRLDAGWSDVGTWASLIHEGHGKDGNFIRGDVIDLDNDGCVLVSDGPTIAATGLRDMVIVATSDAVLAVPTANSQDVRRIVAALKDGSRTDLL